MDIHDMVQSAIPLLTRFALRVIGAFVLWVIGRRLIECGRRLVIHSLKYPFDQTVATYIGTAVSVILNIALINSVSHTDAIRLLKERLRRIPNVVAEPAPDVEILTFTPLGPVPAVRPYCHNDHYWQVYFDTNMAIREVLGDAAFPGAAYPVAMHEVQRAAGAA